MSLIHHDGGIVFLLESHNLWQLGQIALHGEHTIDDNQFNGLMGQLLKHALEVVHVVVLIMQLLCKSKTSAIHNTCMVAVVADDVVVLAYYHGQYALIDAEACREAETVIFAYELGDFLLQLYV